MADLIYLPKKIEIFLCFIVIALAAIITGIIFPLLISTDKLPLIVIICLLVFIFFLVVVGLQSTFVFFYKRWHRRYVRRTNDKHSGRSRSKQ